MKSRESLSDLQPLRGWRNYLPFLFSTINNETSTKLKKDPRRGYIIVEKIDSFSLSTSKRLHKSH